MQKVVIVFAALVISGLLGTAAADDLPKPSAELQVPEGHAKTGTLVADLPKPSAELRVLEDLIGTWDEQITNKPTEWAPEAKKSTAVTKRAWSLGGKFIRAEGTSQPAKTEFLQLMSYDPDAKYYRSWYYDSAGSIPRGSTWGAWDAKSKTITWTATDDAGNKTVGTNKIMDKDHSEWTMIVSNPEGKVVLDFSGKCTRRRALGFEKK